MTQKNRSANANTTMGSKTPIIKEKKEICEVCNTKFVNLAGLVSHQSARHPELKNRENSIANKSNSNTTSRISKRIQIKKGGDVDTEENVTSTAIPSAGKPTTKTEFKCPKCDKTFPINFQAVKHIKKKHSEDDEGNSLSSDSLDLLKPVPVERCSGCNKYFDAETSHKCLTSVENSHTNIFYCLGCDHRFMNLIAFHKHVVHVHHENMDNMFFKTMDEFEMWKKSAEAIVKMKYLTLNKGVAYRYYSCNYVSTKNTFNTTYLCPSLIMAKSMESGIQIHYNKTHCEHSCPKYVVPNEFSKYLTNKPKVPKSFDTLIKKKEPEETQQSLYKKYQKLMENIKIDAAKVGLPLLKKLFNSALKMQGLFNSHDDDDDNITEAAPLINRSMTDDQITNILESKRTSARLKRKSETRTSDDAKKPKVDDKAVLKENKEFDSPKQKPKPLTTMSPSFNDSYKQFLGTTESKQDKSKTTKRKEIVKTKIGQFSPKKKSPNINDNESMEKNRSSPNILKPSITNKIVKEIKYEVREQENDCNILVLKI